MGTRLVVKEFRCASRGKRLNFPNRSAATWMPSSQTFIVAAPKCVLAPRSWRQTSSPDKRSKLASTTVRAPLIPWSADVSALTNRTASMVRMA